MKKYVVLSLFYFCWISAPLTKAEDSTHSSSSAGETGSSPTGERKTNRFAEYDTLISKFEKWSNETTATTRVEQLTTDTFKVTLAQEDLKKATNLLKEVKTYLQKIEDSCTVTDPSAKALAEHIDSCIAKGVLSDSIKKAKKTTDGFQLELNVPALSSCKFAITDYFLAKQAVFNKTGQEKFEATFPVDLEFEPKLNELFDLFGPKEKLTKPESPNKKLVGPLKETEKNNLCFLEKTSPTNESTISNKLQSVEPTPKKSQKAADEKTNYNTDDSSKYSNKYSATQDGYKYNGSQAYDPTKYLASDYKYNPSAYPSYNGAQDYATNYGAGIPYLPNMNYQKPNSYQPSSHPTPYYPPPIQNAEPNLPIPVVPPQPYPAPQPGYPILPILPPLPPITVGTDYFPPPSFSVDVSVSTYTPSSTSSSVTPLPLPLTKPLCPNLLPGAAPCGRVGLPVLGNQKPNPFYANLGPNIGLGWPNQPQIPGTILGPMPLTPQLPFPMFTSPYNNGGFPSPTISRPPTFSPVTQPVGTDPIRYRVPRGIQRKVPTSFISK